MDARVKGFFKAFVEHLDESLAYDSGFFFKEYQIPHNVSQYWLKKAAYDGDLTMVKIRNRTFFIHRKYFSMFKPFAKLKHVKVI
jgi:uncharacterized Fe-S cluster-containing MiaB family protein